MLHNIHIALCLTLILKISWKSVHALFRNVANRLTNQPTNQPTKPNTNQPTNNQPTNKNENTTFAGRGR